MDRKKTILTAVLINAAILVVLFVTAMTTEEEISHPDPIAENQEVLQPLFQEPIDLALKNEASSEKTQKEEVPYAQLPIQELVRKEEAPVHKLPPLVKENKAEEKVLTATQNQMSDLIEIKVKKGDSLDKIARAYHTSVDAIIRQNHLPSSFLRIGQKLQIPTEKGLAKAPKLKAQNSNQKMAGPEYYTVKVGDNPWTIAMKHHLKVDELLKLNGLNEEKARKLRPGDRLRIR